MNQTANKVALNAHEMIKAVEKIKSVIDSCIIELGIVEKLQKFELPENQEDQYTKYTFYIGDGYSNNKLHVSSILEEKDYKDFLEIVLEKVRVNLQKKIKLFTKELAELASTNSLKQIYDN